MAELSQEGLIVLDSLEEQPAYNTLDLINHSPMMVAQVDESAVRMALRELEAAGRVVEVDGTYRVK